MATFALVTLAARRSAWSISTTTTSSRSIIRALRCAAVAPPAAPEPPFTPAEQEAYERLKERLLTLPEIPRFGLEHDVVDAEGNAISYGTDGVRAWLLDLDEPDERR